MCVCVCVCVCVCAVYCTCVKVHYHPTLHQAKDFYKKWKRPGSVDSKEMKRRDSEKGMENVGRSVSSMSIPCVHSTSGMVCCFEFDIIVIHTNIHTYKHTYKHTYVHTAVWSPELK